MKPGRQSVILDIISKENISTQNQLLEALAQRGIKSTQATLSRDIKELHLIKTMSSSGRYHYAAPAAESRPRYDERLRKIFRESVTSYAAAQNIVVIKTLPGLGQGACSAIDAMDIRGLVGSLAGDDTLFLAMRDVKNAEEFCEEIQSMLQG